MDRLGYSQINFLFILTLIQRDDGQKNRVFKARMVYHAACGCGIKKADGNWNRHPHWFELARVKWMQIYKKTGTPCSCWLCRGEKYDRRGYVKETLRIIAEA